MEEAGASVNLYLIGKPVRHSLSPAMYNHFLARAGIPGEYRAIEVPSAGELPEVLERLRVESLGFNVTVPYKVYVANLVDELDPHASALGAVNTVKVVPGGLAGFNTDWLGFRRALERAGPLDYSRALIIGAGGAGRATAYALSGVVDELFIVSRSGSTAEALASMAEEWGIPRAVGARATIDNLRALAARAELIVNASPVGMGDPGSTPLPGHLIPQGSVVLDMVYRPLRTRLLREASTRGCRVVDGLWMLVYQAVENIRIWLGLEADPVDLRRAALAAAGEGE